MSFHLSNEEQEISCDNCGDTDNLMSNSSGDVWCENCGWSESDE